MEKYGDLKEFKEEYQSKIKKFMENDFETRVVFLNADFGWGKSTFIKDKSLLGIPENCVYSPWLNNSDNYLEEIYFHIKKKDKGRENSKIVFMTLLVGVLGFISSNIISLFSSLCNSEYGSCQLTFMNNILLYYDSNAVLFKLIEILFLLLLVVFVLLYVHIFMRPVPLINFFKEGSGKYYEDRIVKDIVNSFDDVFVIEDVDRLDNIENILIAANKISEYIIGKGLNKYVLITGDFNRTGWRIGQPSSFYNNSGINDGERGPYVIDRVVSLLIQFPSIESRMKSVIKEKKLDLQLKQIEVDEIINFIKTKKLSVRFFVRFLNNYENEINEGQSLFHLLIKFYQEDGKVGSDTIALENSLFNIKRFPVCMNDYELLLEKEKLLIDGNEYTLDKIIGNKKCNSKYEIINCEFNKLFSDDIKVKEVFKEFYTSNIYPRLNNDTGATVPGLYNVGSSLKPTGIINNLEFFLLGTNNNEGHMENLYAHKRCYFQSITTNENYEDFKIKKSIPKNETKSVEVDEFYVAYFACFMRNNQDEISKYYPCINEVISKILQ